MSSALQTVVDPEETDRAYRDIMEGCGYYVMKNVHSPEEIQQAEQLILGNLPSDEQNRHNQAIGTPFENYGGEPKKTDTAAPLNKRLYHLLPVDRTFRDMMTNPRVMAVLDRVLGKGFINGTYSANCLFPGTQKQEPHLDYPYWDAYENDNFPKTFYNATEFPQHVLACQTLTPITQYNAKNGGVGFVPGSHKYNRWPDKETWEKEHIQPTVDPGSVIIHTALLWHAAMTNNDTAHRIGISGQWLPRYVKPMEDISSQLSEEQLSDSAPIMRQLCGYNYPYPTAFSVGEKAKL